MRKFLRSLLSVLFPLVAMATAPSALAQTTTISFNDIPSNSSVTTQFQNVGVLMSGVTVINQTVTFFTNPYGTNVALAESGLMTITLNPSIIGSVQSVSGFLSGANVIISAYDASNLLVGQTVVASGVSNQLFSITSSGNPITTVQIQGAPSAYAVDLVRFVSNTPFAKFGVTLYLAPKLSAFAATETFTLGANSAALNPATQAVTLNIGALSINLPAGSFNSDNLPRTTAYVYRGKVNNVDLYVLISPTGSSQSYLLFVLGGGYAFQNGLSTVPVTLTIGNNSGTVNVAPHYVPVVPVSP